MACEGSSDYQIGVALILRVVKDQIMKCISVSMVDTLSLPENPVTDDENKKIVAELAKGIQVIGDSLDQHQSFNNLINRYAPLASKEGIAQIVANVFDDGMITWGRIIVLFYAVGKLSVKMLQVNLPQVVSDIVNSSLDFFKTKLLVWIRNMGGWISSISGLAQFSLEQRSGSPLCRIPVSAELVVVFFTGVLIGGLIVWKMNKSS